MKRLFAVAAVLVSVSVFAQTEKPKATNIIFGTNNEVIGDTDKPGGGFIVIPKKPRFGNLIKVRGDFQPELAKSVERVK